MTTNSIDYQPTGYTTVAPWLATSDTAALFEFIVHAFGGEELARVATKDGSIGHGEIRIGDTILLAFDSQSDWPAIPALIRVWVSDSDAAVRRAVAAGAKVITPISNNAFGQRGARVRDPFGNIWWVDTQTETVTREEIWDRLQQPDYADDMRIAQASLDIELSGRNHGRDSAPVA
ncbi:MAG: VOC family protein [Mycobacterium sp.]